MSSLLQRLRQKPDDEKKRIAVGTSAAITGLIFVMWVTVLNNGFTNLEATTPNIEGRTQTASPLSAFGDNASAAFGRLKSSLTQNSTSSKSVGKVDSRTHQSDDVSTRNPREESNWMVVEQQESEKNSNSDDEKEIADAQEDKKIIKSVTESIFGIKGGGHQELEAHFNSRDYNPLQDSGWITR